MPVDLQQPDSVIELVTRTERLIRDVVIPAEDSVAGVIADGGEDMRLALQAAAREVGVFAPHAPVSVGGLGLNMVERFPVFEAAGYSAFGPLALNIAAPDEGNVHLLSEVATPAQREAFLTPLVAGDVRSAFAMTEPAPGAGSDPGMLSTTAVRDGADWVIRGRKHFITGADGAGFFIVMARTSGEVGQPGGATMFLVDAGADGLDVGRHIPTTDRSMIGGHCEVDLHDVRVREEAVLGEVDEGFRYAQVRLGPARMTHCMRWLGLAQRAQDVAITWARQRDAFSARVSDLGQVQQLIADNEIDLAASRALVLRACWELDQGRRAGQETSVAKAYVGEALTRIVDRATQMCGGMGVSEDLPLARIMREVRPFRIYDGPTEVHRWSIARRAVRRSERAE